MIINNTKKYSITINNVDIDGKKARFVFESGHSDNNTISQYELDALMLKPPFKRLYKSKAFKKYTPSAPKKEAVKVEVKNDDGSSQRKDDIKN